MEICGSNLLNCSTNEYSLLLRVLLNSTVSSSLTPFFFCGCSTKISFSFLFSSISAKSSGLKTHWVRVSQHIFKSCWLSLPPMIRISLTVSWRLDKMVSVARFLDRDPGFVEKGPLTINGFLGSNKQVH